MIAVARSGHGCCSATGNVTDLAAAAVPTERWSKLTVDYARGVMIAALRERVLSLGADASDSSDLRVRKRLLVGIALLILPAGLLCGCL